MYRGTNPNAFVPNSDGFPRPREANRRSQQRSEQDNDSEAPIKHTSNIDTMYFQCQEDRFFYPYSNYEVVRVQTKDRNPSSHTPNSDTFFILNFPIDQLSEYLLEKATRLNPRHISLCNPLSSEVFLNNYNRIMEITKKILYSVVLLTKITLCVDVLDGALFRALRNQSQLREVEILLPSYTSPEGLDHIQDVLKRGYSLANLLPQVDFFTIPPTIARCFPATANNLTLIP
jgi:hypothetical protein